MFEERLPVPFNGGGSGGDSGGGDGGGEGAAAGGGPGGEDATNCRRARLLLLPGPCPPIGEEETEVSAPIEAQSAPADRAAHAKPSVPEQGRTKHTRRRF